MSKLSMVGEIWAFVKARRKWWLAPMIVVLMAIGALLVLAEGSALAPFIYALF